MDSYQQKLDALLLRMARRDRRSLTALYREEAPRLFGVILAILPGAREAETALIECFDLIWRKAPDWRGTGMAAEAWLVAQARLTALEAREDDGPPSFDLTAPADPRLSAESGSALGAALEHLRKTDEDKAEALTAILLLGRSKERIGRERDLDLARLQSWIESAIQVIRRDLGGQADMTAEQMAVAQYLLGLMPTDEAALFEEWVGDDPTLLAEMALWSRHIAAFALIETEPRVPPPHVLDLVQERVAAAATGKSAALGPGGWLRRLGLIPAVLGATAAGLIAWVAIHTGHVQTSGLPGTATSIIARADAGEFEVILFEGGPFAGIWVTAIPTDMVPDGHAPHLWVQASGTEQPVWISAASTVDAVVAPLASPGDLARSDAEIIVTAEPASARFPSAPGEVLSTAPLLRQ